MCHQRLHSISKLCEEKESVGEEIKTIILLHLRSITWNHFVGSSVKKLSRGELWSQEVLQDNFSSVYYSKSLKNTSRQTASIKMTARQTEISPTEICREFIFKSAQHSTKEWRWATEAKYREVIWNLIFRTWRKDITASCFEISNTRRWKKSRIKILNYDDKSF
jgi:hypothetical protein